MGFGSCAVVFGLVGLVMRLAFFFLPKEKREGMGRGAVNN